VYAVLSFDCVEIRFGDIPAKSVKTL